jgi:glutamine amidotransferase
MKKIRAAIVDHSLGNLFSVLQGCLHVGFDAKITSDPADLEAADLVILPGVGAFKDAMRTLHDRGITEPLLHGAEDGKPLIGICLGMQLLMERSEEFGNQTGLGLIKGEVLRFRPGASEATGRRFKVPQIGWNRIEKPPTSGSDIWLDGPLSEVEDGSYMYFLHSYYVVPNDPSEVLAETRYAGYTYCSALRLNNIVGFQFHPERSGLEGLNIYRGFASLVSDAR